MRRFLHISGSARIKSGMFEDEIKRKLAAGDAVIPFTVCMLSKSRLVVSGVRSVLKVSEEQITLRLTGETLSVDGAELRIVEIGGGDAYITGSIGGLSFEKTKKRG